MGTTFFQLASGNYTQDWANAGLITANDDWSGVANIIGFRGDGLTGSTGTDPKTILADGSGTPIDVIANQSATTLSTGGIAEFDGIANPVIAFQGSGTADAPHLVFHIDATGRSNIQFDALLRDLDTDPAVQPVAFQYRVGTTSDFTNVDSTFVADANNGGTTAVSFVLPADTEGQPQVQIRAITTNAVGVDTFIGIDDIVISSDPGLPVHLTENFNDFTGAGFAPVPTAGQFDSDDYIVAGLSDGSLMFGDAGTTGDFARGPTDGTGETTGGVYALDRGFGDMAVWFQPSGSDLTLGEFTVRITNAGADSDSFSVAFDLLVLNDQARANSFNVTVSTDNVTYGSVPALDYTSTEAADASGVQEITRFSYFTLGSVVANGSSFFVRFTTDDVSGSGSRDEFGIDNLVVRTAEARSLIVTTTADVVDDTDSLTSLREAIAFANDATAGTMADGDADNDSNANDTITFANGVGEAFENGGTITLGGTQLEITSDVTIDGTPGVTVDANGSSRVLAVTSGAAAIDSLSITGGDAVMGGGVRIYSGASADLTNSTVSGNSANFGGGIENYGTATLSNTTVSGNDALTGIGGGINNVGTLTLTNSTVSGNTASTFGGGISSDGAATLTNTTVSGNTATSDYGGGIYVYGGTATLTNTIVLGNTASATPEIAGGYTTGGPNIIGDGIVAPVDVFAVVDATTPSGIGGLLADNGGPVQTIALLNDASNPALDAGDDTLDPATDARGLARFDNAGVANNGANFSDLGAFELQGQVSTTPVAPLSNDVTTDEDVATSLIPIGASDADGDTLTYSIVPGSESQLGTVTLIGGSFVYTPRPDATGEDAFSILISDGVNTTVQSVGVTINPIDDAPIAVDDMLMAVQDTPFYFPVTALLGNDIEVDGEVLSITQLFNANHGTVEFNAQSGILFTPAAGFQGLASFQYRISDGNSFDSATVRIDVVPVEEAPNEAPNVDPASQVLTTFTGTALALFVDASDPESDPLTYTAGTAAGGTVTGGAGGAFIYTPGSSFVGTDSFEVTVSDGQGNETVQTVNVTVVDLNFDANLDWLMITQTGFVGRAEPSGMVFGTNGFEDIAVLDGPGVASLDPSFNNGGDILRLEGDASDWSVVEFGSQAVFSDGDTFVAAPAGPAGLFVFFADGIRTLGIDAGSIVIGDQTVSATLSPIIADAETTVLPEGGADPGAAATLILLPGADFTGGGDFNVFGTNASETVTILDGDVILDPSFNRGNDTVLVGEAATDFAASIDGSNVMIAGTDTTALIPIGTAGMPIDFDGDARTLVYDVGLDIVFIGSQEITAAAVPLIA